MRMIMIGLLAALSAIYSGALAPAFAADEINTSPGLTKAGAPLALHGFDPVAFFTKGKPVEGKAKYEAQHNGASYYFESEGNLAAFKADPAKYAPAYGGFCAYGVSVGKKFDGNPNFWKIVDGKLYLNLDAEIAGLFAKDVPGAIDKANGYWPDIEHKAAADL